MNSIWPETSTIVNALGWALLHSLWQGILIYTLLRILLYIIPSNYAVARYYLSITAMTGLTAWFVATLINQYETLYTVHMLAGSLSNEQVQALSAITPQATSGSFDDVLHLVSSWFNVHAATIVTVYTMGLMVLLGRLIYNIFSIKALKTSGTSPADDIWLQQLALCTHQLDIRKRVQLMFSSKVGVPMVMGALKPVILIPVAIANKLTPEEAEAILLHELAHIKRHDYLVNMIQMVIETLLFFNPFVWMVSSLIRKEREHCCDDMVVHETPNRLPYAKALAALETYRLYPHTPALAATGHKNQLLTRIKRIMEMKKNSINYTQLTAVLLVIVLLISSAVVFTPQVKAQSKDDKKKTSSKDTKTKKKTTKLWIAGEDITVVDDNGNKKTYKSINDMPADERQKLEERMGKHYSQVVFGKDTLLDNSSNVKKEIVIINGDEIANEALASAQDALENIDIEEIVTTALDAVNWDSIGENIDAALSSINWDEVKAEVRRSMDEVKAEDMDKVRVEVRKSMNEAREAMDQARKTVIVKSTSNDMAENDKEVAAARKKLEEAREEYIEVRKKAMEKRRDEMKAAAEERRSNSSRTVITGSYASYDRMLRKMEQDGLINVKKGYKIEKKGNTIYIDGIKQSKEVYKKYEPMMDAKELTIKGKKDNISINVKK